MVSSLASSVSLSICVDIVPRVLRLAYVSFNRYVTLFPPSLQWIPWPLLSEALRFSTFTGTYGVVRLLLHPSSVAYGLPWHPSYPSCERRWRALLGSWEIPLETCPELGTPAIPGRPSQLWSYPDAAFRSTNGVGIATIKDFGAEPSRPASLLCTLRTHPSPGEWQHSLPACSLALAGRDLHPLDFIKWFHLLHYWFLLFHAFPSAIVVLFIHLHVVMGIGGSIENGGLSDCRQTDAPRGRYPIHWLQPIRRNLTEF